MRIPALHCLVSSFDVLVCSAHWSHSADSRQASSIKDTFSSLQCLSGFIEDESFSVKVLPNNFSKENSFVPS